MATKKDSMTPMMRQFHYLKKKHPDAVLLFRCGDFYETYEQDAKVCADVLGITLTKRTGSPKGEGYMAGFPYHALDTYLPKLVRSGKRVAICDQLEPPKPTKKSAVSELINNLTTNNRNNNPQTTENNMKLTINNANNTETKNTVANPATIVAASQTPAGSVREAEAEEITDEQPAPKKVTIKRKNGAAPAATEHAEKTERTEVKAQRFSIVPYTNKQGEKGYFLFGFTSQEEAKGLADRMAKSVREGFRYENHVRYDVVGFPPRYAQMAQQMCDALNAGDAAAVAKIAASTFDVYAAAVADGKAESDRKRAERKEAEAKAKAKEVAKVKKSAGLYSKEDVAAMLADVLAGKDVPEDIKALLAA